MTNGRTCRLQAAENAIFPILAQVTAESASRALENGVRARVFDCGSHLQEKQLKIASTCTIAVFAALTGIAFAQSVTITEYALPAPRSGPVFITAGSDGALWFTETGKIGRITTAGAIREYALPNAASNPQGITAGPDGALWFAEDGSNRLGRITTAGVITEYPLPKQSGGPFSIISGPDGALWYTHSSSPAGTIGRISTVGTLIEYPTPLDTSFLTNGPDGAIWFTESEKTGNGKVGRMTTAGVVTEFPFPNLHVPNASTPTGIVAGPDGALWFAEIGATDRIWRMTTAGTLSNYVIPTSFSSPEAIVVGPDGALWFTEQGSGGTGKIGRISTSGTITEYALPSATNCFGITLGPDGALWFTEPSGNKIGRAQVTSEVTRSGVLPHIAAGDGWTTAISIINTSPAPVSVTVDLRTGEGKPLVLPVTTSVQGITQNLTTGSLSRVLAPNSTLRISAGEQSASLNVGWVDVASSAPVGGFAIFRQTGSNGVVSEGTVPLQTQFQSKMVLPFDNTGGFVTGVALTNLAPATATINATILDQNGAQLGVQSIVVAGSGHTSLVLPSQLPASAGAQGVVVFQNPAGPMTGIGLRFSPANTFTSVPTILPPQ
jgi:virginiamycin B lyase